MVVKLVNESRPKITPHIEGRVPHLQLGAPISSPDSYG